MRTAATIGGQIIRTSNDYSLDEKKFREVTGRDITHLGGGINQLVKDPISIVIPTYVGERLDLVLQNLESQIYRNFEVVIVDDGSPNELQDIFKKITFRFPIKYIRLLKNKGRSAGRNIGISVSDSKIVAIIDSDMIPPRNFTAQMAMRHHFSEKSLFVGFRECIEYEDYTSGGTWRDPVISNDWRYQVKNSKRFLDLTIRQSFRNEPRSMFRLVEESNNFKGFSNGTSISYWDLPCMVIGHSLCFKKNEAIKAGGFIEGLFKGWGMEDIAFGASMIANENFVIPALDWVSYHINHKRHSGSHETEGTEFKKNVEVYLSRYLNFPRKGLVFPRHILKKKKRENNISYYESEK